MTTHAGIDVRVRVLLFARYRDLAGTGEIALDIPRGSTAAQLIEMLRERHGFGWLPAHPVVAHNRTYAALEVELADADEIALLPPVAGG